MSFNEHDYRRYCLLRGYITMVYPAAFTRPNSGRPKHPLSLDTKPLILMGLGASDGWNNGGLSLMQAARDRNPSVQNLPLPVLTPDGGFNYGGRTYTKEEDINFFLRIYCSGLRYWFACRNAGADRFSPLGIVHGFVTEQQANYARDQLMNLLTKRGPVGQNIRRRYRAILAQAEEQQE